VPDPDTLPCRPRHRHTRWPIALSLALASVAAGAQEPGTKSPESEPVQALEAITVTAQRREQQLHDVPLAVSVVDAPQLGNLGAAGADVRVLAGRAPSLNAESSFGRTFPRFYLRGLGNTDFDLNASQPVSLVYDDIVLENPTLKGFPVFDIERVEVLRGPQGTLFGRNTPAGVVKFDSVRPAFEPDAFLRLGVSRFDTVNFEAAAGGQVGASSAGRISTLYQRRDDFADNRFLAGDRRGGFEEFALRGQWLLQLREGAEALVQLRARSLDGGSAIYRANAIQPGSNRPVPGFDRFSLDQDARPRLQVDTLGGSVRLAFDLGGSRLVSISGYESVEMFARGDVDGGFGADFAPPSGPGSIPFPAESGDGIPAHRQLTQELRLESDGLARGDWQLGAFVFDENLEIENFSYDTLAGSRENGFARQRQDNRAWALFAAGNLQVAPRWRLGGGLRYTRDRRQFQAERLVSPFGAGPLAPDPVRLSDGNLSGDASISFAASDAVNLYGRLAQGFRAPAVQGRLVFGDEISIAQSETITSVELGLKADLFERRARLGLAVFEYRLDDAQLTAVGGQANFNRLLNAERVAGRGVELELEANLARGLSLGMGVSYNHTRIEDPGLAVQPCASGCIVLDPPGTAPGTVSVDGNPLPHAPRWIAHVEARYGHPVGPGEVFIHSDWSHRSEVNFFLYRSVEFTGRPITEGGLRLGYAWQGGNEVAIFARNVLDQTRALGGVDFNNLTAFYNDPRVLGIELTLRH